MNIANSIIAMKLPELTSKLKADSSIQSSIDDLLKAQRNAVTSGLSDGFYLRGILGKIRPQVSIRRGNSDGVVFLVGFGSACCRLTGL